ncbi:hypothetical protein CF336_g8530, partial [Tilletia laevis]
AHETYEESFASLIHPTRRIQPDSAPFRLSPDTISVVERQRRMHQHETQTQESHTETEHYFDDKVATPRNLSATDVLTYNHEQLLPSISSDLSVRDGSLSKSQSASEDRELG